MLSFRVHCLILSSCLMMISQHLLAGEYKLPLPSPEQWKVETTDGKVAVQASEPGILTFDYDLKITRTFTLGFKKYNQATARVLLTKPVILPVTDTRLLFECRGMDRVRNREGKLQFMPLICDAEGEILICEPYAYPHLNSGTTKWGLWTTTHLLGGEAGGPTQNVYQTDGTGNGWPDAPLSLIGFEIQARGEQGASLRGQFALGDVSSSQMMMPARPPFLYADSLLNKGRGKMMFSSEAATEFQGPPRYTTQTAFDFDESSLRSRKTVLMLPTGSEEYFWADICLRDEHGQPLMMSSFDYRADSGVQNSATQKIVSESGSRARLLRLSTAGEVPGVIPSDKPFGVTAQIYPPVQKGSLQLRWRLIPVGFPNELASGNFSVTGEKNSVFITLPELPGRYACRVVVDLLQNGRTLDQSTCYIGRITQLNTPYQGRVGLQRLRGEIKQDAYFRTTFRQDDNLKSDTAALANFHDYIRESSKMARDITISVDAARFEVLPGVYDFSLLDQLMDSSADYGAGVTLRLVHEDVRSNYLWPRLERQRNYDGSEIYHHHYGNYSPHDPELIALWQRANRALYQHYRTHPAFQGYYVMQPAGESVVLDQPWLGIITGYSRHAKEQFRTYLQQDLKLDLAALNKRWSKSYQNWRDVEPPLPDFSLQQRPDLRPEWFDFERFKAYVDATGWFLTLTRDIRTYDPDHIIIVYRKQIEPLKHLVDYSHGGGVPERPDHGELEKAWLDHQVGAIQESAHPFRFADTGDPGAKGWVLDWNVYTMFSIAGGGGMNLHIYYYPQSHIVEKYGGVYGFDRFQKFKPIMSELSQTRLVTPLNKQVATLQDPLTRYTKHRTIFSHRAADLGRWFDVLLQTGIDHEQFRSEQLGNYKLVLPNLLDEVMDEKTIGQLAEFVNRGGHMVIAANTGRYSDKPGDPPYALLRSLKIKPPTDQYVLSGMDISASILPQAGSILSGLPQIRFYTLEKQRHEARLPWDVEDYKLWPYRWLSETDYFGYYPKQHPADCQVLAQFADGGAAVSQHNVGKGQVIVLWGTPDFRDPSVLEFLKRTATWANVHDEAAQNPVPLMMEARNDKLNRHYVILWQSRPGAYRQRLMQVPDGRWMVEDIISEQRLGIFDGSALRNDGLTLEFRAGFSPLKVLRLRKDIPFWATSAETGTSANK